MATELPKTLRNFSMYIDSVGYAGKVTELTLPTLSVKAEEYRAGGLDVPVKIDMGMEALEAEFTLAEYEPKVLKLMALYEQDTTNLTVRGALQDNGSNDAVSVKVVMNGSFINFDPGSMVSGEMTEANFTFACRYYKLSIGNEDLIEIDIINLKRIINGTDQLESVRVAIGTENTPDDTTDEE